MEADLHHELTIIQGKLDALATLVPIINRHDKILFGNGDPGLIVKVDRLVESDKRHKWAFGVLGAGLLVPIVEWFGRIWK